MNIPQQILSIVLGLTLLSPTLAMAQTSSWHLVATDDSENHWYLDINSIERDHRNHQNHHAGYVKVDGKPTEIALNIDCQDGAILNNSVINLSAPELIQLLTHQSTFAQAMANEMCKDR